LSNVLTPYISSNVLGNVLTPYISSNVLSNVLIPYKPVWKTSGTIAYYDAGNVGIGKSILNYNLDVSGAINADKFIVDTGNYIESNCIFQISKNINVRKNYIYDQFNNVGDTIYMAAGRANNVCSLALGVDINLYSQTGSIGLSASNITIDGNLSSAKSIKAGNLVNKTPFIINASASVVINGISGLYKYDLDLRQYTGYSSPPSGYLMRYFKITTIYTDPAKYFNNANANSYCFSQNIMITNSGGLTFFSPYTLGSYYGEFIGNDNYWMRNSFDYITFIHGHISDISNPNKKWYVIIEDLLA